ncbi:MAG: 50S ribosomal protein L17 [candidate division Zixibacteria bacterium]|nr:50S ribosomal protein L17 [candidate division Zixibacteria bacterium]
MRHGRNIDKLGVKTDHRKAMLANMATSLMRAGRITTTLARAKALTPVVSRLVTFAKRGDLHSRRMAATIIRDKEILKKLFAEIGPELKERNGGYTRVVKAGYRRGDGASLAVVELLIAKKAIKEEKESKEAKPDKTEASEKAAPKKKAEKKPKKEGTAANKKKEAKAK